nr:EOG090X0EB8 [Leptodora kindtii]
MAASTKLGLLVRKFSTTASVAKMVKPPIQVFSLEGRYASALYSAASKQGALEQVEAELVGLQSTISTDTRLAEFIDNPILKRPLKVEAFASIAKKLNMSDLSSNLLQALAENGRLSRLDTVITTFKTMMAAHRGEVPCQVTSAKPLDADTLEEVKAAMSGFLQEGQILKLTTAVDESILGGLVVVIGDRYVDMSLSSATEPYPNGFT